MPRWNSSRPTHELRQQMIELAGTGNYTRRDLAKLFGIGYDRVCELTYGVDFPGTSREFRPAETSVFAAISRRGCDKDYEPED